jgi:hypothetical protein
VNYDEKTGRMLELKGGSSVRKSAEFDDSFETDF